MGTGGGEGAFNFSPKYLVLFESFICFLSCLNILDGEYIHKLLVDLKELKEGKIPSSTQLV